MKENLISVLMPVYNGEKYLREAIDSVLAQTYSNFELLLINDGSIDSSKEIILSYTDPRIRYIENEQNLKLIATLNKGIDLAKGEYIARMDADDYCSPKRFEKQMAFLQKHSDIDFCSVWGNVVTEDGREIGKLKGIDAPELINCSLFFTNPINHPGLLCRTQILKTNKYKNCTHAEDMELWITLRDQGYKMANIPKLLYTYRWYESNVSNTHSVEQKDNKKLLLKRQLEDFFSRTISEEELDLHQLSFELYRWEKKNGREISLNLIEKEKKWLELLSQQNKKVKKFDKVCFDSLLFSRWIVCCLYKRKYREIFQINLPWYNARILHYTLKLLLYK